jgi:NAD(P)H-hydrate repair Nnr-like enzyme with NAD(P)H-hydrate dehydratase domain
VARRDRGPGVVCGCGGGDAVGAAPPRLLSVVLRLVVDAAAGDPTLLPSLFAVLLRARLPPSPCLLEGARLLGSSTAAVQGDRLRAARELAERYRAVVVVKGSGTVVAVAGEAPRVNATGSGALASAGTGDVLAGWIGGRWASAAAASAFDVATRAVIEHGAAAEPAPGAIRAGDLIGRSTAAPARARGRRAAAEAAQRATS